MSGSVPTIDKMAGIELYTTRFAGIGGSIKVKNEDFRVVELFFKLFFARAQKNRAHYYSY